MIELTSHEKELLNEIAKKRRPEVYDLVEGLDAGSKLKDLDRQKLQQLLLDEMYEHGLESGDEPNQLGKELDSIIGKLEYY